MGRLTRRKEDGTAYVLLYSDPSRTADVLHERAKKEIEVIQRLAHYEDMQEAGRLIEVIRCKDCDHYNTYGCSKGAGWCEVNEMGRFDNGYCHLAKLKELEG